MPRCSIAEDYQRLAADIELALVTLETDAAADMPRLARKLRKQFTALAGSEFFPGEAQRQVLARLDELDRRLRAGMAPGEPSPRAATIARLDPAAYQGRVWATRAHPWVDRLASAWLIRRFIDRHARLLWLASPADCRARRWASISTAPHSVISNRERRPW